MITDYTLATSHVAMWTVATYGALATILLVSLIYLVFAQKNRLASAIDNMTQGLLLFDANKRVLICNQRYIELYGVSPDIVKPGCSLRDLISHRKLQGSLVGDVDEYCARVTRALAEGGRPFILSLEDGRSIQIIDRPMNDGGWVSTHEDITERRRIEKQIEDIALRDYLTGLPNRRYFLTLLAEQLDSGAMFALLFVDVDDFRGVNDTLGHEAGDAILRAVASRLQLCANRNGDFVARFGGDEFVVVRRLSSEPDEIDSFISQIFLSLQEPVDCSGHSVRIDVSIGVGTSPTDGRFAATLMREADIAMYQAKAAGKNRYMVYRPEMSATLNARRRLESDLRQAILSKRLDRHGFSVVFQPLIAISDGRVTSCEALIRWNHPYLGFISPEQFIPIAEDSRLIVELGDWVLNEALAVARLWPNTIGIAVNVSPVQFLNSSFALKVLNALAASGVSPHRLELEITEAVLIGDANAAIATLHELRSAGVGIALDDFGTGYSSLSYLQLFPFNKIKIDKSFISRIALAEGSVHIVRAIVDIAVAQHMTTTAEGVESEEQLAALERLGCTEMQGFLFSPPVPAGEICVLLMREAELQQLVIC
jgi:diguanylate cyclase (GGDEF)-like protein